VPLQLTQDCLVASIQIDLSDAALRRFHEELLDRLRTTQARAVLLDLAGLDVIDAEEFAGLRRIAAMAKWMGARPIFVGLRAGVASSLVDLEVDITGLEAAPSLDRALELARARSEDEATEEVAEQAGEDHDGC
jgi:rsbT antagonist protein RsbS